MTDFISIMEWLGVPQYLSQNEKEWVTSTFVIRRTKADVCSNSNIKCEVQVRYVQFSTLDEIYLYSKVFTEQRNHLMRNKTKVNLTDTLERLLRVRQLCIHPQLYLDGMTKKTKQDYGRWHSGVTKLQELITCIKKQPQGDKAVVFCQFVKEMDAYMSILRCVDIPCVRLDGTMTTHERNKNIHRFKNDTSISTFVIQINTGGQGINLQVANHVYIMSPNWNPAIEYQAIGRCFRTGQTKNVYVTRFCITSGCSDVPFVEENIIDLQERKKKLISHILNDERIVDDGVNHVRDSTYGLSVNDVYRLFHI